MTFAVWPFSWGVGGEDRDRGGADEDAPGVHLLDAVDRHIAHRGEHHRGHRAEGRADRAEDGETAALFIAGGDDLRQRTVRNVDAGVEHAEENVGDIDPGKPSARGEAPDVEEHQNRGQCRGQGEDLDPVAVAPIGIFLRAVDQASPDRVVDRVPDTGDDRHDHDVEHADLKHVGVVLVQHALRQTEDKTGGQVAEGVTDFVLGLDAAGAGNVRGVHSILLSVSLLLFAECLVFIIKEKTACVKISD